MASDDENEVETEHETPGATSANATKGAKQRRPAPKEDFESVVSGITDLQDWLSPLNGTMDSPQIVCEVETKYVDSKERVDNCPTFEEGITDAQRAEIEKKYAEDKKKFTEASGKKMLVIRDLGMSNGVPDCLVKRTRRNFPSSKTSNVNVDDLYTPLTKKEISYMKTQKSFLSSLKHVEPKKEIMEKLTKFNTAFIVRPHCLNPNEEQSKRRYAYFPRLHVIRIKQIDEPNAPEAATDGESKEVEFKLNEALPVPAAEAVAWLNGVAQANKPAMATIIKEFEATPIQAYSLPIASSKYCTEYKQLVEECNTRKKVTKKRDVAQVNGETTSPDNGKDPSPDTKKAKRKTDDKSKLSNALVPHTASGSASTIDHSAGVFNGPMLLFPLNNNVSASMIQQLLGVK